MEKETDNQRQLIADCYTAHLNELMSFATSRLGSREEAEDTVQDAFVRMMGYEEMICGATVKSFVFTIVANKIKDQLRRRIFRNKMEKSIKYEMSLQHCKAEHAAEYHDTKHRLERCIANLTPACAKVYRMSLFLDMTTADIAQELNTSKRTVEGQLLTARKRVRERLVSCF